MSFLEHWPEICAQSSGSLAKLQAEHDPSAERLWADRRRRTLSASSSHRARRGSHENHYALGFFPMSMPSVAQQSPRACRPTRRTSPTSSAWLNGLREPTAPQRHLLPETGALAGMCPTSSDETGMQTPMLARLQRTTTNSSLTTLPRPTHNRRASERTRDVCCASVTL